MQVDKHIIDKVNEAHRAVLSSSKEAVKRAIEAGQLLNDIKGMVEHGEFLTVVNSGMFEFSERTAYNYMKVADYSANLQPLADLQTAYRFIESEEAKKKQAEQANQRQRLEYRSQHNEKPATWQRSDDYAWKKLQDERTARDERIAEAKAKMDTQAEASKQSKEEYDQATDFIDNYMKNEIDKAKQLESMRITNQNGNVLDALQLYLDSLPTDSKRIEECHNIIKFCKAKSASYQQI